MGRISPGGAGACDNEPDAEADAEAEAGPAEAAAVPVAPIGGIRGANMYALENCASGDSTHSAASNDKPWVDGPRHGSLRDAGFGDCGALLAAVAESRPSGVAVAAAAAPVPAHSSSSRTRFLPPVRAFSGADGSTPARASFKAAGLPMKNIPRFAVLWNHEGRTLDLFSELAVFALAEESDGLAPPFERDDAPIDMPVMASDNDRIRLLSGDHVASCSTPFVPMKAICGRPSALTDLPDVLKTSVAESAVSVEPVDHEHMEAMKPSSSV
jgi:hypothetical protein